MWYNIVNLITRPQQCVNTLGRDTERSELSMQSHHTTSPHVCSISGCGSPHHARGFCGAHYARWRKYGDPLKETFARHSGTLEERFWTKVNKDGPIPQRRPELGPCWLWTGSVDKHGYGQLTTHSHTPLAKTYRSHRLAYEFINGPIPDGLEPDHLCRVHSCVNPSHLEPVPHEENMRRGNGWAGRNIRKTHCPQGHPYDLLNTYFTKTGRDCRTCNRERAARLYREGQR